MIGIVFELNLNIEKKEYKQVALYAHDDTVIDFVVAGHVNEGILNISYNNNKVSFTGASTLITVTTEGRVLLHDLYYP